MRAATNWHITLFLPSESLETVDYISKTTGDVVFRASPNEKPKLVFQIGTATDENAVKVAKYVQQDVAAIGKCSKQCPKQANFPRSITLFALNAFACIFSHLDVNMGCPKPFSCDFGMGAALLQKPDRAKDILRALVKNVPLPITCKIRFVRENSNFFLCKCRCLLICPKHIF